MPGADPGPVPQRVAVRSGLFVDGEPPLLVTGRCRDCGRLHFPCQRTCPYCSSDLVDEARLGGRGRLWAYTAVTAPPPGYEGEVPYGFGVVELDEGLRVIGRLTEADPAALRTGQAMSLAVVPLHADDRGRTVVTYAFAPAHAGAEPAAAAP
jgi:uncharacterized OB-fold protein